MALPLLLLLAALRDVVVLAVGRRRFMGLRLTLFGWVYLAAEFLGIAALGALWLVSCGGRNRRMLVDGTYAIQRWWANTLFRTARAAFELNVEVDGADVVSPGPVVVLMRHVSIVDNLLPNLLITDPHGIKLRYVLKRELLSDPALDIAGNRLPNYFVDRAATDSGREVAAIGELGNGLGADEGVLIYPEGTRFTPERRRRILARLERSDPDLHRYARALNSVLPPRLGGPLALLSVEPAADVVIAAHTGLDGFSHIRDILSGGLVGTTIRVRLQRFSHDSIPTDRTGRVDWLQTRWAEVDEWVTEQAALGQ